MNIEKTELLDISGALTVKERLDFDDYLVSILLDTLVELKLYTRITGFSLKLILARYTEDPDAYESSAR